MPLPRILVSPHTEEQSGEFPDAAVSLSRRYSDAILSAGGLPLVLPTTVDPGVLREAVALADGVLLSGGDDVAPQLYAPDLPAEVRATVEPAVGRRDLLEFILIDEVFRQGKPLLAICRGHQVLNVALGGTLIADIPRQRPESLGARHNQPQRRFEAVHDVLLEPDSRLARLSRTTRLGVNSTHHQAVDRVAPPLRVVGRGPDLLVEALELATEVKSRVPFLISVQYHPERLQECEPAHAALFREFVRACRSPG